MKYKTLKANYLANKELKIHYQELFETAMKELDLEKLSVEFLLGVLCESETLAEKGIKSKIIKAVIQNAKERHYLDKMINQSLIFKK